MSVRIPEYQILPLKKYFIPHNATTEELIAKGGFKKVHRNITANNFPLEAYGWRQLSLINFLEPVQKPIVVEAIENITTKGKALFGDLLCLGSDHAIQEFPAVCCFGSSILIHGKTRYPLLRINPDNQRSLHLGFDNSTFNSFFSFLIVDIE